MKELIEQYRIIFLLIKAVLVREDGIDVRIYIEVLQSLHAGMGACLCAKRGGRKMVLLSEGKAKLAA